MTSEAPRPRCRTAESSCCTGGPLGPSQTHRGRDIWYAKVVLPVWPMWPGPRLGCWESTNHWGHGETSTVFLSRSSICTGAMIAYNCAEPEVCVQLWWLGICLLWSSKFITGRYVGCFSRAMYLHIVSRFHLCCSPQHSNFWMFIFPNVGSSIAPKRWKSWKPGDDGQGIKKHHPDPSWKYLARRSALSSRVTLW